MLKAMLKTTGFLWRLLRYTTMARYTPVTLLCCGKNEQNYAQCRSMHFMLHMSHTLLNALHKSEIRHTFRLGKNSNVRPRANCIDQYQMFRTIVVGCQKYVCCYISVIVGLTTVYED